MATGTLVAALGLLILGSVLLGTSAEGRPEAPARFGQAEALGDTQLFYTWGKTVAIMGYDPGSVSQTEKVGYKLEVRLDNDAVPDTSPKGNWTVGSVPRFFLTSTCRDQDATVDCDATYDYVKIYLVWDSGSAGASYDDARLHALTQTQWVYASTTITNQVSTGAIDFDAGTLCAGPTGGSCLFPWTPGDGGGAGLRNGPASANGLNYVGTYRLVVEAKVTNAGVGGGQERAFNSDECYYWSGNYRCSIPGDTQYIVRHIGFLMVNEAAATFRPTDDCSTLDYRFLRGQNLCLLATFNAPAWKSSGDLRGYKATSWTGDADVTFYGMTCATETHCWVAVHDASDGRHGLVRVTRQGDDTLSFEGPWFLVTPSCTVAGCDLTVRSMQPIYFPGTCPASCPKLALFYTQQKAGGTQGSSLMRSVWSFDGTQWTQLDQDRIVFQGSSSTNTFGFVSAQRGKTAAGVDLLLACAGSDQTGATLSGPTGCALWEGSVAAPSPTASWSDVDGTNYGQGTTKPHVCLAEGPSDTVYVTYHYTETGGSSAARILRGSRAPAGTWSWGTAAQGSANSPAQDTADIPSGGGPTCHHTGTGVIWLLPNANDPLSFATPQSGVKLFTTADFNGQSPTTRKFPPNTGRGWTNSVWANNTLHTAALAGADKRLWFRLYDSDLQPQSENASLDLSSLTGLGGGVGVDAPANFTGESNRTFIFAGRGGTFLVVNFGLTEAVTLEALKSGSTPILQAVEELNTPTKNRTGAVPLDGALNEYAVRLRVKGYGGFSGTPWTLLGCTSACAGEPSQAYVAPPTLDPDTDTNYAGGGLFVEDELLATACLASPNTPRAVLSRGDAWGFACTLKDEWDTAVGNGAGGALLRNAQVSVLPLIERTDGTFPPGAVVLTTNAEGIVSCGNCFQVESGPTHFALDTYTGNQNGGDSSPQGALRFVFPPAATFGVSGTSGSTAGFFDVDAEYYLNLGSVAWDVVMRGDEQRASASFVTARNEPVPEGTRIWTRLVDPTGITRAQGAPPMAAGALHLDYAFPMNAERGTWTVWYNASANATNRANSLAPTNGASFTHASEFTVTNPKVELATASSSPYFNAGETIRPTAALHHADGGPYVKRNADGTSSPRSARVHVYLDARSDPGSMTTGNVPVAPATGELGSEAVLTILSPAPDSYASTHPSQAEATDWDLFLSDGGTPGDPSNFEGNYANVTNLFDIDRDYYLANHSLWTHTALLRDDTQRAHARILGVRGQLAPDATRVRVHWHDGAGVQQETDTVTTLEGVTAAADYRIGTMHAVGVAHVEYDADPADPANLGNRLLRTGQNASNEWPISNLLLVESASTNTTMGGNALKAYNRGEEVALSGCVRHPDAGPVRRRAPTGDESRLVTMHLHAAAPGSPGHTQGSAVLGPGGCAFNLVLSLPSTAPDTYASLTSNLPDGSYDWNLRAYDGSTDPASSQGNSGSFPGLFDVDAGVYVERYHQGRNNTDATDTEFNAGTDGTVGPDSDFTRVYLRNVRGEATNQFNNLQVARDARRPFAWTPWPAPQTATLTLNNSQADGFYEAGFGAWPLWTYARVNYTLQSQDSNGNTALHADPAPSAHAGGRVSYIVARMETMDTRVLRSQAQVARFTVCDAYEDYALDGWWDCDTGTWIGGIAGNLTDYIDSKNETDPDAFTFRLSFSGKPGQFSLLHQYASTDPIGYRDVKGEFSGGPAGKLRGLEWYTDPYMYNHHARGDPRYPGYLRWVVSNQTEFQRAGYTKDILYQPGDLAFAPGATQAVWTSSSRDYGQSKLTSCASPTNPSWWGCLISVQGVTTTSRLHVFVNNSNDNFATLAGSAYTLLDETPPNGTLQFQTPSVPGRYYKVTLIAENPTASTKVNQFQLETDTTGTQSPPGRGDNVGAWLVTDLRLDSIRVERETYWLDEDATVDVLLTYAYSYMLLDGVPENESYASLTTRLFKAPGVLADAPAYADRNTWTNATTNQTGKVSVSFQLTPQAQTGGSWYVESGTYSTPAVTAGFTVAPLLGEPTWYARYGGNDTMPWVASREHMRGEQARVRLPVLNNPEDKPLAALFAYDEGLLLTSEGTYDPISDAYEATWRWPASAAAQAGTPHAPNVTLTVNGGTTTQPTPTPAHVHSNFTLPRIWTSLQPHDVEEHEVFLAGAQLVWEWANQTNVRGEPYLVPANYTWTHQEPASRATAPQNPGLHDDDPGTRSSDHGFEPEYGAGELTPHVRTGVASFAATAPVGTWRVTAAANDGRGNTASRTEEIDIVAPISIWSLKCPAPARPPSVGERVNVSCYFLERQGDGSDAPIRPQKPVFIQWFAKRLGENALGNLTPREPMALTPYENGTLAWVNFTLPRDLALYLDRSLSYRVDTVYNGIAIDAFQTLALQAPDELYQLLPTSDVVVKPGRQAAFTVRTLLHEPELGDVAFGPDSCGTSHETMPHACQGDGAGVPRLALKAINASCACWATYNDPQSPQNDDAVLTTFTEMQKDHRYRAPDGTWARTYTLNWTPPYDLKGRDLYVVVQASFHGRPVTRVIQLTVEPFSDGGSDPLYIMVPSIIHVNQTLPLQVHASFTNGTARTSAAGTLFVTIKDDAGATLVAAANPVEEEVGVYYYHWTPTRPGIYKAYVTTQGEDGALQSGSSEFRVTNDTEAGMNAWFLVLATRLEEEGRTLREGQNTTRDASALRTTELQAYLAGRLNLSANASRDQALAVQAYLALRTNQTSATEQALLLEVHETLRSLEWANVSGVLNGTSTAISFLVANQLQEDLGRTALMSQLLELNDTIAESQRQDTRGISGTLLFQKVQLDLLTWGLIGLLSAMVVGFWLIMRRLNPRSAVTRALGYVARPVHAFAKARGADFKALHAGREAAFLRRRRPQR